MRDPIEIARAFRARVETETDRMRVVVGCVYRLADAAGEVEDGRALLLSVFESLPPELRQSTAHDVRGPDERPRQMPGQTGAQRRALRAATAVAGALDLAARREPDTKLTAAEVAAGEHLDALRLGAAILHADDDSFGAWLYHHRNRLRAAAEMAVGLRRADLPGGGFGGGGEDSHGSDTLVVHVDREKSKGAARF